MQNLKWRNLLVIQKQHESTILVAFSTNNRPIFFIRKQQIKHCPLGATKQSVKLPQQVTLIISLNKFISGSHFPGTPTLLPHSSNDNDSLLTHYLFRHKLWHRIYTGAGKMHAGESKITRKLFCRSTCVPQNSQTAVAAVWGGSGRGSGINYSKADRRDLPSMQMYLMRTVPSFQTTANGWSCEKMKLQWFFPEHLRVEENRKRAWY